MDFEQSSYQLLTCPVPFKTITIDRISFCYHSNEVISDLKWQEASRQLSANITSELFSCSRVLSLPANINGTLDSFRNTVGIFKRQLFNDSQPETSAEFCKIHVQCFRTLVYICLACECIPIMQFNHVIQMSRDIYHAVLNRCLW